MQNYQKKTKKVSFFIILIMLFNFLVNPVMTIVNATSTNLATSKVTELTTKLNNINQKIQEEKQGLGYDSDKALQQAITKVEEEVSTLKTNLDTEVANLETDISIAILITGSGNTELNNKLTEYLNLNNTLPTYDINTIDDIKYEKEGIEQTLITKEEIATLIINEYLTDDDTAISSYLINFDTNVDDLKNQYLTLETKIDNEITVLDNIKLSIENYISDEKLLGNIPNEIIESENIITLLENIKNELGTLKNNIDLSKITEQETKLDELSNKAIELENKFNNNNKTYIDLGLDTEIGVLETYYDSINQNIAIWFNTNGLTEDYSLVNDKLDIDLINFLKEAIAVEEQYTDLSEKIDNYLLRKASDKDAIDTLMEKLNSLHNKLNQESVLSYIEAIVNNTDLSVEANVDMLYNFLSIDELSDATRKKIENAKLSFYILSLIDETNYTWEILEDEIIIKGLKSSLSFTDLQSNISFTGIFGLGDSIMKDYISDTSYINLADKNYNLIKTYKFLIQGDLDNNGLFEDNDVTELTKLILEKEVEEKELLLADLDNDNEVTIKDLILLQDLLKTEEATGMATKSNIKVIKTEDKNKIHYDLILEADGIVEGLQFNLGSTSDLKFVNFESDYNILLDDITNPSKIIGNDKFKSGQIIRLTYELNDTPLDQTSFIASNIILVNTSDAVDEIERIVNTMVNQIEEENNVISTNNVKEEQEEIEVIEEVKEEQKGPELEISDLKVEENEEEKIAWGNVIKIVIIVLLGALIIYFLNKKEEEKEIKEANKKDEK